MEPTHHRVVPPLRRIDGRRPEVTPAGSRRTGSAAYTRGDRGERRGEHTGPYVTVAAHTEVTSLGNRFGSFWNDRVSFLDFCP
jgi:hypothetical protein